MDEVPDALNDIETDDEVDQPGIEESSDERSQTQQVMVEKELSAKVDALFSLSECNSDGYIRLGCVNHAFHNVVGDGLKVALALVLETTRLK